MKKICLCLGLFFGEIILLSACHNAEYDSLENAVYISETQDGNLKKVTIDDNGGKATLTVRVASAYDEDVKIKIGTVSEEELAEFNKKNGTSYVALPVENYILSEQELTIKQGKITAPTVEIAIKPLAEAQIGSGDKYVLPLSIISANKDILRSSKSIFYSIDQVIVTTAPYMKKGTTIKVDLPDANIETLTWTLEYRIWVEKLYNTGNDQAQTVSYWGAGPATEIYFRWGDANVTGDLIMTKTQGGQFISTKHAKSGQWYHHAWVHDGKTVKLYINGEYDTQMDSPGKMSKLSNEMSIDTGKESYMYSEWRFWTVARTAKQIKENMFSVNSKSEGLEVYFKMNEGKGKVINDHVGKYTINAEANKDIEWRTIRSDQQ